MLVIFRFVFCGPAIQLNMSLLHLNLQKLFNKRFTQEKSSSDREGHYGKRFIENFQCFEVISRISSI
jgi:hypothetical protein